MVSHDATQSGIFLVEGLLPPPSEIPKWTVDAATEDLVLNASLDDDLNKPIRLTGQYTPPKLIKRTKPKYPLRARQDQVEGVVIAEATTDIYGKVQDVKLLRSIPKLDNAAIEAIKQWKYEPMLINGRPRSVIFTVTVIFKLEKTSYDKSEWR